jgi:sirohydrochlorin ferrochelatase
MNLNSNGEPMLFIGAFTLLALITAQPPTSPTASGQPSDSAEAQSRTASALKPTVGTLIVAHGGGPGWNAQVEEVAGLVNTGGPVAVSFLMGPGAAASRFQDAAERLVKAGATEIVVVPVLVSSHSGHYEQIRYLAGEIDELDEAMLHHLHMAGIGRAAVDVPIRVAPAMDDAPEIAVVLADRAKALAAQPGQRALMLVGHGPNSAEDNAAWMANLRRIAEQVKARSGFREVKVGLVRDDAPVPVRAEAVRSVRETIALLHELTEEPVVVVPILVSKGQISDEKLPADLAGLTIVYDGQTLLPHPEVARWIESRVRAAARPEATMR